MHAYGSVLIKRWEAHNNAITKISKIVEPQSYVSCGVDKLVKIWGPTGELFCKINLVKLDSQDCIWNFPFDWIKQKLNDIELVFQYLIEFENDKITEEYKEKI